jgi:hypothetical protein
MATAPWSPHDLAKLHDGLASVDADDPFTTVTRTSAPVSWRAASVSNGNGRRNGNGTGHHGPVTGLKPIAWRAPARFVR